MSEPGTNRTTAAQRLWTELPRLAPAGYELPSGGLTHRGGYNKRVRPLPDGSVGIAMGGIECAMSREEAAALCSMILEVISK